MTSPPSLPNPRRRRIVVAIAVLVLGLGWWCWPGPEIDPRLVGRWEVPYGFSGFPSTLELRSSGRAYWSAQGSFAGRLHWRAAEGKLCFETTRTQATIEKAIDSIAGSFLKSTYFGANETYPILDVQEDTFRLGLSERMPGGVFPRGLYKRVTN